MVLGDLEALSCIVVLLKIIGYFNSHKKKLNKSFAHIVA